MQYWRSQLCNAWSNWCGLGAGMMLFTHARLLSIYIYYIPPVYHCIYILLYVSFGLPVYYQPSCDCPDIIFETK